MNATKVPDPFVWRTDADLGLELDEPVWNHAVFSKNRDRLLNQDVAREFFSRVLAQAEPHFSEEHFSVDGTLIEA